MYLAGIGSIEPKMGGTGLVGVAIWEIDKGWPALPFLLELADEFR